jgi:hypothetical protein
VALVQTAQGCDFREAVTWLADFEGVDTSQAARRDTHDNEWARDSRAAEYWRIAAEALAEEMLEALPLDDPARRAITELLLSVRVGPASLVAEFRGWRTNHPALTKAMCLAGSRSNARVQRRMALWLRRYYDESQSA